MREVVELQQMQLGTVQHMERVGEKLQAAEQKQKQMVSFLANVFKNASLLPRLKQMKHQKQITSPRTMRKFLKHKTQEPDTLDSSLDGQIAACRTSLPDSDGQYVQFPPKDTHLENLPFKMEDTAIDEIRLGRELLLTDQVSTQDINHQLSKGKNVAEDQISRGQTVASPVQEQHFSFIEGLEEEVKNDADFLNPELQTNVKKEELWGMDFETGFGVSSFSPELWGNLEDCDMQQMGTNGFPDIWDFGSLSAAGSSGLDKSTGDEWPSRVQAHQHTDDTNNTMDP